MSVTTVKPLTPEQVRKLEGLRNRPTYYEALVIRSDGERRLLALTARNNKAGLRHAVWNRAEAVLRFLGTPQPDDEVAMQMVTGRAELVFVTGGKTYGRAYFSGRTERETIMAGDRPPLVGAA